MLLADRSTLELRLPAAALRLWGDGPGATSRIDASAPAEIGVARVASGLWLLLPTAGRPAVFDAAVDLAARKLSELTPQLGTGKLRALITPAAATLGGSAPELLADPLLDELRTAPPRLAPDAVHLTTHAALGLESRYVTASAGQLDSRSGRVVPLVLLGPPAPGLPPWRNPQVLTRTPRWIPRALAAELTELATGPALRITGPIGVGKTRLAWEVLKGAGRAVAWRTHDFHPPSSTLVELLSAERQRPLWLVYDGLEAGGEETWAEIETLLARRDLGRGLHLLLIGRAGTAWPGAAAGLPELRVPTFEGAEWDRICQQLFHGLALPPTVAERLAAGAAGNPFALEEGLVHLVRDRQLRQVFGSFFFGGRESEAQFQPSARLRLHAEAEAARIGDPTPLRLLALTDQPVPPTELRAAAQDLSGADLAPGWHAAFVDAGLSEATIGPWGEGLRPTSPAIARALGGALSEGAGQRAREVLGELLAARSSSPEELWAAWPLLAGTDEGARTLLAVARSRGGAPRDEQFAALRAELASLSERGADRALELDLLWALLPLARRLGRLHELQGAIERGLVLARKNPERFVAIAAVSAELAQKEGRLRDAETVLRNALTAARDLDDRRKEVLVIELGRVLVLLRRTDEARDLFSKTQAIAERAGRSGVAAQCLFLLGNLAFHDLDFAQARELHQRALELRRKTRLPATVAASLAALGAVALAEGNVPEAIDCYEQSRAALEGEGSDIEASWALLGLGRALARLGDFAGALPVLRRSLQLREGRDDARGEAIARVATAGVLLRLGHLDEALAEVRRAHFSLAMLPESEAAAEAEQVLGDIHLRQRRFVDAARHYGEAERLYRAVGNEISLPDILAARLEAAIAIGEPAGIAQAFAALDAERVRRPRSTAGIACDFQLYNACEWLRQHNQAAVDPLPYLESAHAELMRETGFLAPELRQRFLFQIPVHQAVLDAATRRGLKIPG